MLIELLYFEGCPSHGRLLARLPGILSSAAVTDPVTSVEVVDDEHAVRLRFLGSPSLRIDGRDVEPGAAERVDYGMKCRVYRTADGLSGVPSDALILTALRGGEDVAIRPADIDDIAALAGLATRFRSDAFGTDVARAEMATSLNPSRSPASFRRALVEGIILVAVGEGRIVGYAQFGPVTLRGVRIDAADRSLDRLQVDGSLQGRGIGRRLMLAALSRPELADVPRIFLRVSEDNRRALALYSRLGFRHATASHFITGATPGGDLVMVLDRRDQPYGLGRFDWRS